ncbi:MULTISPECIES: CopG family transcriptional regulator [unclassified Sphingomonas]
MVGVRLPPAITARLDAWADDRHESRAAAIRLMIVERLDADGY